MPKIILGGGKTQTIKKFFHNVYGAEKLFLLIDLDGPEQQKESDLYANGLAPNYDKVFYMIQEMESWFLSQPEILDDFFGKNNKGKSVSEKITKRKVLEIPYPKDELKKITKDSRRGVYHEIKHAVELLKTLDPEKLENDFQDFRLLIDKIKD